MNNENNEKFVGFFFRNNFENISLAKEMLESGVNINYKTKNGATALIGAVLSEDFKSVKWLLQNGANFQEKTKDGIPLKEIASEPIQELFENAKLKEYNIKLENIMLTSFEVIHEELPIKEIVFRDMIKHGNIETIDFITEKSPININIQNEYGCSFLHDAIEYRQPSSINWLLNNGIDVSLKDSDGKTALIDAVSKNSIYSFEIKEEDSSLSLETVHKIIEKSSSIINESDFDGNSPLMYVCERKDDTAIKLIDILIKNGSNINQQNSDGITPLISAIINGSKNNIERLLQEDSLDVNITTVDGETAIFKLIEHYPSFEIFEKLIEKGADTELLNNKGLSLLNVLDEEYMENFNNNFSEEISKIYDVLIENNESNNNEKNEKNSF